MEAQSHTICEYIELMCSGKLGSEKLTAHCLDAIDQTDGDIHAWIHLDREVTLNQARTCDDRRKRGLPLGRLHGMPVGVKDIFDTVDFPTECGSVIYKGRQPDRDSAAVERLKEAGAVILGKTVSTEFAFMHAAGTANPHNFEYSPGGSSSGSAAAVAAGQVPMALGTQTAGSVIRPASFCGVYGYKPSRGIISRRGVLQTSQSLDQVGVFGQHLEESTPHLLS